MSGHLFFYTHQFIIAVLAKYLIFFNPFHVTGLLLHALKKPEKLWFFKLSGDRNRKTPVA